MPIPALQRCVAAIGLAFALVSSPAAAQDPYQPGLRWSEGASAAQPWIARRVAFAGDGQAVWAGRAIGFPGVTLFAGTDAGTLTTAFDVPLSGAVGAIEVATGRTLSELYCAAQYAGTTAKQTVVARYSAFEGAASPLKWSRVVGTDVNGGALLAVGPSGVWVARFDSAKGLVRLAGLHPDTGQVLLERDLPATALRGLELSADGNRLAFALGNRVAVWSATGVELASFPLSQNTEAFDLSADGRMLAAGGLGFVRLWRDDGQGFKAAGEASLGSPWLATRAVLAADGRTLGAGFWNAATGDAIRFVMWNLDQLTKLHDVTQTGIVGGMQNFPEALAITPDGQRLLCGAWGSGGPHPQLLLLDRDFTDPVYSTYTPGSVLDVALDEAGAQLAVCVKAGHSNQFSTTGFVQLFDTGERDLQLVGAVELGTTFTLTSKLDQSVASFFVFGEDLSPTGSYPGIHGALAINPALPHFKHLAQADASGRADFYGGLPADPALLGLTLTVQAVFLGPFGLEFSVAAPRLAIH